MPKLVDLDQIRTMLRVTNSHIPSILDLVHVKSGTVHYLTNPMLPSKVEGVGIFTASSDYTAGDTIQINGTAFAVKTMNGTTPPTGMFKSGATVVVGINYQSKSITFKVEGGVGGVDAAGLKLATASAGDVLSGKTFYSGNNSLKTGTRTSNTWGCVSGTEVLRDNDSFTVDTTFYPRYMCMRQWADVGYPRVVMWASRSGSSFTWAVTSSSSLSWGDKAGVTFGNRYVKFDNHQMSVTTQEWYNAVSFQHYYELEYWVFGS